MKSGVFLLALALAVSLFVGCSKSGQAGATGPKSADLGAVELAYNSPSRHDLGDGLVCVLTAQPMNATSFELFASLEKSGKQIASARIAPATINQPTEIVLGQVTLKLTPQPK